MQECETIVGWDLSADFLQIQSYQGVLAKIYEFEQQKVDLTRIQIRSEDRQAKYEQKSQRALGLFEFAALY